MASRQKSKGERNRRPSPKRARPALAPATEEQPASLATDESAAALLAEERKKERNQ